jgi:hypothetical protein
MVREMSFLKKFVCHDGFFYIRIVANFAVLYCFDPLLYDFVRLVCVLR